MRYNQFKEVVPTVINAYGPTETTITSLVSINSNLLSNATIKNTKAYILDASLQPVPIGVVGELYMGGIGVARGYLNRPELTQASFIENPFATAQDIGLGYTKLYKTGDMVMWHEDGKMEFLGRNDDQVKIRGYRVELNEVEHAIAELPGVKKSCVLVKERDTSLGSIKYLVGYYVLNKDAETLTNETIVTSLANGKIGEIKSLLNKEVYNSFNDAIKERSSKQVKNETTFIGINSSKIKEQNQNNDLLEVTVNFISEIITCIKDKDDKIISGDPQKIKIVNDTWKFARNVRSQNPNWQLIETEV